MARSQPRGAVAALPGFIEPELATLVGEAPLGDTWVHEMKLDGYRLGVRVDEAGARLLTRRGNDWTESMPSIAAAAAELLPAGTYLDGELCVLRTDGVSDFQLLQNTLSSSDQRRLVYFTFDALFIEGEDLRSLSLLQRKARLSKLLAKPAPPFRLSEHLVGDGDAVFRQACKLGLEGIVSKRAESPYRSGRARDWVKVKCTKRQELVIGGFTDPSGSRAHLGALHVGAFEGDALVYAGKVGTGFSAKSLEELHRALAPLIAERPPFANPPRGAEAARSHWVKPRLVCEVAFTERTSDGRLRHPSFLGLRKDKLAREVVWEG